VATFGVATVTTADTIGTDRAPTVDTDDLRDQLEKIRDSLDPLLSDSGSGLSLSSVDISLTLERVRQGPVHRRRRSRGFDHSHLLALADWLAKGQSGSGIVASDKEQRPGDAR
jgi:hypothetical protein